jgi:hypothetical protein
MASAKPVDLDALLDKSGQGLSKSNDTPVTDPSDSSDSGADLIGVRRGVDETTDPNGTGERASIEEVTDAGSGADIAADEIVDARHAGLGHGLDQAEEAQFGVTDEELERARGEDDE